MKPFNLINALKDIEKQLNRMNKNNHPQPKKPKK